MGTASRTRNALGERMFETTWTTRDNSFKGRRPTGRREGHGWEAGGSTTERPFPMIGNIFRAFLENGKMKTTTKDSSHW